MATVNGADKDFLPAVPSTRSGAAHRAAFRVLPTQYATSIASPMAARFGRRRIGRRRVKFIRGAWKVLVAIKDAMVLCLLLLFFGVLFATLAAVPNAAAIAPGALVLKFDGPIVEQPAEADPFALAGGGAPSEHRLRDVLRAIEAARTDARVKAVVLDLESFGGAYPAALIEVGQAIRRVRDSGKPVLAYATAYPDGAYMLAANASEIWIPEMGGATLRGIGGSQLYYKNLIDRLGVNAHVYKAGTFKEAVEPFTRTDMSPEAREANTALYGALFDAWRDEIKRARPKAQIDLAYSRPAELLARFGGDFTRGSVVAGFVDKVGDRIAFGKRVAALAGNAATPRAGEFATIRLANWIAAHPVTTTGAPIGVLTIAGPIVDGDAPVGTAGGDTIARALTRGLAEHSIKALVVRVDSPGGSAWASERIRAAILEAKSRRIPVVVSMGSIAASGGYWVATPGDRILAEPTTITGSIGVFGVLPTFENTLAKIGVTSDSIRTAPLAGQPDTVAGTTPEFDAIAQGEVDRLYRGFVQRVSQSRKMTPQAVDRIAQGRVWIGGTARQLGLIDGFGGMGDAIREAARLAKLDPAKVHAVYFEKPPGWEAQLAQLFASGEEEDEASAAVRAPGVFGAAAAERRAILAQALGDVRGLLTAGGVQARCLECAGFGPTRTPAAEASLLDWLIATVR